MINQKTDNDKRAYCDKVKLRECVLKKVNNNKINIVELYGGKNKLWKDVKSEKELNILSFEKEYKKGCNIYGDSLKYIRNLDLQNVDVIDMDAYGNFFQNIPEVVNNKTFNGCYFIYTFIATMGKVLTNDMYITAGIKKEWVKKCTAVFEKKRKMIFEINLFKYNVEKYYEIDYNNKKYGYFYLPKKT